MKDITVTDVRCLSGDSAFLIDDGTTSILYDTGFGFTGYRVAENIARVLGERKLDYIFLTHSHYDHALGCPYILRRYPDAKVVAGRYAASVFCREGALRVMRELDGKYAARCVEGEYEFLGSELRVDICVDDGDMIQAGDMRFEVIGLPGHTRCSVGFYCREIALLLATETLGVYDGEDVITPSFLVGCAMTLESIDKAVGLDIRNILSPHFGLLDEAQTVFLLENMKKVSSDAMDWISLRLTEGGSDEEVVEEFMTRYCRGNVEDVYPEDAARLNTTIMVALVRRELLEQDK